MNLSNGFLISLSLCQIKQTAFLIQILAPFSYYISSSTTFTTLLIYFSLSVLTKKKNNAVMMLY